MEVAEYTTINQYTMQDILDSKNISTVQGKSIIIVYPGTNPEKLKDFFDLTLKYISKIVFKKGQDYYIISDKYKTKVIEPFISFVDVSDDLDSGSVVDFIISKNKS